jgi:hypothetical protein
MFSSLFFSGKCLPLILPHAQQPKTGVKEQIRESFSGI